MKTESLCASGQKMTCQVRNSSERNCKLFRCRSAQYYYRLRHFRGKLPGYCQENAVQCGNSLCEFWKFGISDLQKIKGIGQKRAVKISAMFALAHRRNESEVILKDKITHSHEAFEIFQSLMGDLPYEEFWILFAKPFKPGPEKIRISEGGVSGTVVDPKKVFKTCLDNQACSHYFRSQSSVREYQS